MNVSKHACPDAPTLSGLIGDVEQFAEHHWGTAPLRRRGSTSPGDVLSIDDIDGWLANAARRPAFRMVRAGRPIPVADYTRTVRIGGADIAEVADLAKIGRLVGGGCTLVLQNLERFLPRLRTFTEALAGELSHPVQANAYLTPPHAGGLGRNVDQHDVIVLQLHGTKCWEVEGLGSFAVGPGDVVYIPRDTPHRAVTGDDASLHLTIGVLSITTRQVLRRVLDDLALHDPLPLGFARNPGALAAELRNRLVAVCEQIDAVDAGRIAAREIERRSPSAHTAPTAPNLRGAMDSWAMGAGAIDLTTQLRRTSDAAVVRSGDRTELHIGDRVLRFPASAQPALQMIVSRAACFPADLVGLDDASRLVVARRLVRDGLLIPA